MPKQTIYNAGIYVRLSKDDERAGESLSIENQKRILTSCNVTIEVRPQKNKKRKSD